MIFEWYSGSDKSGEIPGAIAELDRRFDDMSPRQRVARLEALLARELDPNWRGSLRFRAAINLQDYANADEARAEFARALRESDPLAASIRDVLPQYADTLYHLVVDYLDVHSDAEMILEHMTALLAVIPDALLGSWKIAMACGYLAKACESFARSTNQPVFYRMALSLVLRAHHLEPDEPIFLEHLAYSYFNVRDTEHCQAAYEMFNRAGPPDDLRKRVDEFMRTRFHEIGGRLNTPS